MTDILQTTGEDLARLAGEMLQPKAKHHEIDPTKEMDIYFFHCRKCGEKITPQTEGDCQFHDKIRIDWPNAMKWRDWAVEKCGRDDFYESFVSVYQHYTGKTAFYYYSFAIFMMFDATPTHYMQAVLLTVERGKG